MPLNFPSSPTQGQTYTDDNAAVWEYDGVKWNVLSGTYNKTFSGARIGLSVPFTLSSTSTAVSWNLEVYDTDAYFTLANPSRITFNFSAFYRINFSVFTGSVGGSYTISIKKNNSTILSTVSLSPNQYTNYDEILEFDSGDYIEVFASDSISSGDLTINTTLEIFRVGLSVGTSISTAEIFSGVRAILTTSYSTLSSPTAVSWDDVAFNQNANPNGEVYWTSADDAKITARLNGFYRLKINISVGSTDVYTVALRKNGATTLSSVMVEPNGFALIDDIYQLSTNDYFELLVNDTASTGSLTTSTYFEMIRVGV